MNTKKILLFLLFAFGLSWLIAGIIYALGFDYNSKIVFALIIIYMFMPALSAFLVQKVIYREEIKKNLLISYKINIHFLWALLIPPFLVILAACIGFLFPGISFEPGTEGILNTYSSLLTPEKKEEVRLAFEKLPFHPIWIFILQALIASFSVNALAAFGEELGWRAFLLKEFKRLSFVKVSLLIGFIWGIWHAPIILMGHNYPQHPQWGVLFMTIFCMLFTFLFIYNTIKARSVIAASIMHGSINAFYGIGLIITSGGNDLLTGLTGLTGFIALGLAVAVLFIYDIFISKEKMTTRKIGDVLQ